MTTNTPPTSTVTRPYGADLTHTLPSARVPEELRTRADARAEQDGTTLSELVRTAVDRYCADRPTPIPTDDMREAWLAAKRGGGYGFDQWLSAYAERKGWTISTPSL